MWTAFLLVMMLGGDRRELVDTRGPYATKEACEVRLYEFAATVQAVPGVIKVMGACARGDGVAAPPS